MFPRSLSLPPSGTETFFLWGPRQTGKTTLLRRIYPDARWVDLLKADEYRRYGARPERLREELDENPPEPGQQVVIDEIQKVPALLDEVHWLIENRGLHFALCGSSARRVRRGGVNLLGGRALRCELGGLSAIETGDAFDLDRMLNRGCLPRIYQVPSYGRMLDAYIAVYLKEEVMAEGLARSLPVFSDFLEAAALGDGELVNFKNVARECGVSGPTIKGYFQILEDTLLGAWLPAFRKRPKRRVIGAPKFYFSDVGVVNRLARRGELIPGSSAYGKAFENWVFHELGLNLSYRESNTALSYWRLAGGTEVDFIVGDMEAAVEAKSPANITSNHLKGLRSLVKDHPQVKRRLVVCREPRPRRTADGIEILPVTAFLKRLWGGELW